VPQPAIVNNWNGLQSYACGDVTFKLSIAWPNPIGAKDVMFIATLQGEVTRTLTINGNAVPSDASSKDVGNATCVFYNGTAKSVVPNNNGCWSLALAEPPHVYKNAVNGALLVELTTGRACTPDCQHGTGMNLQKLFVR